MAFTGGVSRENGQNFETNAGYMYPPAVSSSGDYGGSAVEAAQCGPLIAGPGANRSSHKSFLLPKLSRSQKDAVQRAKKYAMEQSIKNVLFKQTIAHQQQQMINVQQSIQRQQALALMCRVYVGTINFEIREDTVKQAFLPFGPIKSISLPYDSVLKKHKGFAFIEYDIPEAASLALEQMNGVMICGFSIKVGRPSNMPQAQPIIEHIMEESKAYNRIYVASIHQDLHESDVHSVFEAFGRIVSCKLAPDPMRPGKHKGYGYIEYDTAEAVKDAVTAMNLFDLGGMYLRVGRCVTPPNVTQVTPIVQSSLPTASAIAAAAITAKLNALDAVSMPTPVANLPVAVNPLVGNTVAAAGSSVLPLPTAAAATVQLSMPPFASPPSTFVSGFQPGPPVLGQTLPVATSFLPGLSVPPAVVAQQPVISNIALGQATGFGVSSMTMPLPGVVGQSPGTGFQPAMPPPQLMHSVLPAAAQMASLLPSSAANAVEQPLATQPPLLESLGHQQNSVTSRGLEEQQIPMQKLTQPCDSRVMVLKNMVDADEVDDELEGEVSEECGKYGTVQRVIIHNERRANDEDTWASSVDTVIVVKIFVEFSNQKDVESAVTALDGRYFAGRSIVASAYDQERYEKGDLSG